MSNRRTGRTVRSRLTQPQIEGLEPRLLLTTVGGGEWFAYQNSQGETVRVTLTGASTDRVELFAYDTLMGGLVDLVGIHNGDIGDVVTWPGGLPGDVIDGGGNWVAFGAGRGAPTEIYSIYIAQCTADTRLTVTTLTSNPAVPGWETTINPLASTNLPTLTTSAGGTVTAPVGSGGVLVGAARTSAAGAVFESVADAAPLTSLPVYGAFPGGTLYPGIMVGETQLGFVSTAQSLGANVQAIEAMTTGPIYGVDSTRFRVTAESNGIGSSVAGLAGDAAGTFFAAENDSPLTTLNTDAAGSIGTAVSTLATQPGTGNIFAVDDTLRRLLRVNPTTGAVTLVGSLVQNTQFQYIYDDIRGLSFTPGGALYAVGTLIDQFPGLAPDPAAGATGPFLISINPASGRVTPVQAINGLALGVTLTAMTIDSTGVAWASGSDSNLYTVDLTTGACTAVGPLMDGLVAVAINSLTVIGDSLYGGTAGEVYRIDMTTGACINLNLTGLNGALSGVTYHSGSPGGLFTARLSGGVYRLAQFSLASALVSAASGSPSSAVGRMLDAGTATTIYRNVTALDFNGATLRGLADVVDLSSAVGPSGLCVITIDTATGAVTRGPAILAPAELSAFAFLADGSARAVNSATNTLYTLTAAQLAGGAAFDPSATGVVLRDGARAIDPVQALDVVTINGTDAVYAVTTTGLIYSVDTATGNVIPLADAGLTGVSAMTYTAATPAAFWVLQQSGANYTLASVELASSLVTADTAGLVSARTPLVSATVAAMGYTNVTAMDSNPGGTLYAAGARLNLDPASHPAGLTWLPSVLTIGRTNPALLGAPVDGDRHIVGVGAVGDWAGQDNSIATWDGIGLAWVFAPPVADTATVDRDEFVQWRFDGAAWTDLGTYVMTINPATGLASELPTAVPALGSITFTSGSVYAVRSDNNQLGTINTTTGAFTGGPILGAGVAGSDIRGLAWANGTLYAIDYGICYSVDVGTGALTQVLNTGQVALTGLSADPTDTQRLYTSYQSGGEAFLGAILLDPLELGQDMGRIVVGGTVAGGIYNRERGIDVIDIGFLWGDIQIEQDLDTLILRQGGGGVDVGGGTVALPPNADGSVIDVRGSINHLESRADEVGAGVGASSLGNNVSALAWSGGLWYAIAEDTHELLEVDDDGNATTIGSLVDSIEPTFRYDGIGSMTRVQPTGMATAELWGFSTVTDTAPAAPPAAPSPTGPYLVRIDPASAQVTPGFLITGLPVGVAVQSIAFDAAADVAYNFYLITTTNELWYVNASAMVPGAGGFPVPLVAATLIAALTDATTGAPVVGVNALGCVGAGNTLIGSAGNQVYSIDPGTGVATDITPAGGLGLVGNRSLEWVPAGGNNIYCAGFDTGAYRLARYPISIVGGVVTVTGPAEIVADAGTTVTQYTSGLYSAVQADFTFDADYDPTATISRTELETATEGLTAGLVIDQWIAGDLVVVSETMATATPELVDINWDNDSMLTAQTLTASTGRVTVTGRLDPLLEALTDSPDGATYFQDWYTIPVMAGQTVTIDGQLLVGAAWESFLQSNVSVRLYDSFGNYMDSLGFETVEDRGLASYPGPDGTQKPITFTAPAAGQYFLVVMLAETDTPTGTDYQLTVTGGAEAAIGGAVLVGSWTGGSVGAEGVNMAARNGGDLGYVRVTDTIQGGTSVGAFGGGNLVSVMARQLGTEITVDTAYTPATVLSDADIGRVATDWVWGTDAAVTASFFSADVQAGASGADANADIQSIYANADIVVGPSRLAPGTMAATGNIGVVEVVGSIAGIRIQLNSDQAGQPGRCDLIKVGGDWGGLAVGVPHLRHGPNGDYGAIYVEGDIYGQHGSWTGEVVPTVRTGGSVTLNDDGGGQLTVRLATTAEVDASGVPVDPAVPFVASVGYTYIGVEDSAAGGVGGVIARLTINGTASMTTTGAVWVGDFDLSAAATTALGVDATQYNAALTVRGTAPLSVYYMQADTHIDSFVNNTPGNLVCGTIEGARKFVIGGSVGPQLLYSATSPALDNAATAQWMPGVEAGVAQANGTATNVVGCGWYRNLINGLNVTSSLWQLSVGGSLGDLRGGGFLGTIVVNSDNVTRAGKWDGVNGVVFAGVRLEKITLGDGLADDGGALLAQSAVTGACIGQVIINRAHEVIGGRTFGLVDGFVAGFENNATLALYDKNGNAQLDGNGAQITASVPAINKVTGTKGAWLTAMVGSVNLDAFQASLDFYDGTTPVFELKGDVAKIDFSGTGARITGAQILASHVDTISVGKGGDGMFDSLIWGADLTGSRPVIGSLKSAGAGFNNVSIGLSGGDMGTIDAGKTGDFVDSDLTTSSGLKKFNVRHMIGSTISTPGTVGSFTAAGNVQDSTVRVGSITKATVKGSVIDSEFTVADVLSLTVKGNVQGVGGRSLIQAQGPWSGNLKTVSVTGSVTNSDITSAAGIGNVAVKGAWTNSNITGVTIGTVKLGPVTTLNGGTAFGITGQSLRSYSDATLRRLGPLAAPFTRTVNDYNIIMVV